MARGLNIPVGVSPSGGALVIEGDLKARQLISTALSDNDSNNAFQQNIGLGQRMIFGLQGAALKAEIKRRLDAIFNDFEEAKLFQLDKQSVKFTEIPGSQILELKFNFVNLESDEVSTFNQRFPGNE